MAGRRTKSPAPATPSRKGTAALPIAQYLTAQIALSPKTQSEIAREMGLNTPNLITMIKQGAIKLPMAQVLPLAKALGIDPLHLYKMAMLEYYPESWEIIESLLKQPALSANELAIIEVIRQSPVINPQLRTQEERDRLLAVIATLHGDNEDATTTA